MIIAHRLSTIRNADIIAVVSSGAIVETGTRDELMEASTGYYRILVEEQNDSSGSASLSSKRSSLASAGSSMALEAGDNEGQEVQDELGGLLLNSKTSHFRIQRGQIRKASQH